MSSQVNITRSDSAVESSLVINHILAAGVLKSPDQTITYGDRTLTYRELNERIHRLAGVLAAQGVKPGDGGHLPANKVGSRVRHKKKLTYAMHLILPVLHCTPTTSSLTTPHPPTHALPRHASLRGTAHLDAALHTLHDTTGH